MNYRERINKTEVNAFQLTEDVYSAYFAYYCDYPDDAHNLGWRFPDFLREKKTIYQLGGKISEGRPNRFVLGDLSGTVDPDDPDDVGDFTLVELNDWLVQSPTGEIYSCRPNVFDKTYELIFEMYEDEDGNFHFTR